MSAGPAEPLRVALRFERGEAVALDGDAMPGATLLAKLNAALEALAGGDEAAASESLQAFLNQVEAQAGKKITQAQADELIAAANAILVALE